MLSREECEECLKFLKEHAMELVDDEDMEGNIVYDYYNFSEEYLREYVDPLEKLISEHFDNPPLKFEELEVGKPYWDNLKECWFIVTEYDPTSYYKYKEINWYFDKNDACYLEDIYENEFDENRYYRKQVEE